MEILGDERTSGSKEQCKKICDRLACLRCYYCDAYLAARHEHDHFPVPAALRGTAMVPACLNCHDLKDRTTFLRWPFALYGDGLTWLTTSVTDMGDHNPEGLATLVTVLGDRDLWWSTAPPAARLFYAKMVAVLAQAEVRKRLRLVRVLWESGVTEFAELAATAVVDRDVVERFLIGRPTPVTALPTRT